MSVELESFAKEYYSRCQDLIIGKEAQVAWEDISLEEKQGWLDAASLLVLDALFSLVTPNESSSEQSKPSSLNVG